MPRVITIKSVLFIYRVKLMSNKFFYVEGIPTLRTTPNLGDQGLFCKGYYTLAEMLQV